MLAVLEGCGWTAEAIDAVPARAGSGKAMDGEGKLYAAARYPYREDGLLADCSKAP